MYLLAAASESIQQSVRPSFAVRARWRDPTHFHTAVTLTDGDRRIDLGNTVAGGRALKCSRAPRREVWREDRRMTRD